MKVHPRRRKAQRQAGFSLIEMMVGLVIGMIAVVVVMQVFALSEGNKRTTTGNDDAQTSGALALTALQRDIRQAGYGISDFAVIGCNVTILPSGWTVPAMAPVAINPAGIPAGDANTDVLMIGFGNSAGSAEGDRVITQPPASPGVFTVTTPASFNVGDWILAVPKLSPRPSPCNVSMEAVATRTTTPPDVSVATGTNGMTDGTLFNLGARPQIKVYAVRTGALTVCDFFTNDCRDATKVADTSVWVPIGDNIVSLRAEYGRDTTAAPMDGVVDVYDQTAPAGTDACTWTRISALRLALVARNTQMDKATVTTAAPAWSGASAAPIDLSGGANWRNYRYRSFETTVPLRNMAWQGVQPSCP